MLPENIPSVTVRGRFLDPSGRPLSGAVTFRAPAQLTFPQSDVILGGPVVAPLDAQGAIEVTLPATDAPDMDPSGWAYIVAEQLAGIPVGRTYNILLPKAQPLVDLADIAPTDPSKPNYVGVPGPKGDTGPAGAPGSRIYTGSTPPAADLGVDGDLYIRYETATVLGVTSTTVSTWQRTAGSWAQLGGEVRGAAWYVNNGSTSSTGTRAGDLLLRTDTGDVYQNSGAGWGTARGNLRGPKGDKGDPGPTGATGAPGIVQSVNGKSAADIVLAAADVGAVANNGGYSRTDGTLHVVYAGTSADVFKASNADQSAYTAVNKNAELVSNTAAKVKNLTVGSVTNYGAGDDGILAVANAAAVPSSSHPSGALLYAEGGALKVRQSDGTTFTVGAGGTGAVASVNGKTGAVVLNAADVSAEAAGTAVLLTGTQTIAGSKTFSSVPSSSAAPTADNHLARKSYVDALGGGEWRASDFGLLTWAFDPAVGHSAPLYPGSGPIRVTAVYLRSAASVTKIVWHFGGYAGGLTTGSWAALYNSAGTRVAQTADLSTSGAEPAEVHNAGGATVSVPLTAAYSAVAGLYYVAWRYQYNTSTGDGPMMLVAESSFGSPPNVFGLTTVRRFGSYPTGAATAPASLTLSSMENGSNRFWAALA